MSDDVTRPAEPRVDDDRPAAATGRVSLAVALLLGAVGTAVVLFAAGKTWATGSAPATGALLPVRVSGKAVTALPDSLALVALAALVALFSVRRVGRVVLSALLALSGAGVVWASVAGASGAGGLDTAAAGASGLTGTTVRHAAHTGWPWVTAVGGLLLLLCGLLALVRGRVWPAMSSRYERGGAPRPRRTRHVPDPDHPGEIWKALDRGEDPTA